MDTYQILHTAFTDTETVYWLFDEAIAYQQQKKYPVWNGYDKEVLRRDIENLLQYKIVMEGQIACIFSICYTDKLIWRERERGDALYLHRIVVNPHFKGQKHIAKIVEWAKHYARSRGLLYLRMDTWADNPSIINYYKSFGFEFVENFTTPNAPELPSQHRNLALALLEMQI